MNYWVIVGEGGGYDEVKNVRTAPASDDPNAINKTTILMDDISFTMGGDGKTRIFVCGEERPAPDVFMLWGHYNEVFEGISQRLTSLGARSINDINAKRIVCSKLMTAITLEKEGIPQAKTINVTAHTPAETVVKCVGLPAVLKPSDGAQGSGVVLLDTEEEVAEYLSKLKEGDTKAFLAQEYISTSRGRDVRVIMIDYKVGYVIQRVADDPGEFRSNVHLGGHRVDFELDDDAAEMCEKIAKLVGLRLCGIDLLIGENGYVVGEVNCTPGISPKFMKSDRFKQLMHDLVVG